MDQGSVERRRVKRANIQAPLRLRRMSTGEPEPYKEEMVDNISLAGVYFEAEEGHPYVADDMMVASVSIPDTQRRDFPFSRLVGRTRVVRVRELPKSGKAGSKRYGIALEFGQDLTALTASPGWS